MKCTIPGNHVKVFGRAIHSLSKIGDELYVEPLEHGLTLRTVNSSRSAYACFVFAPDFFHHYDDGSALAESEESEDDTLRCKITMKSCLTVFKSLSTIEKTVERCKVTLDMKECKLTFQLYCKHGIVKTHNLSFIECETLQAVFSKDMCPNILTAHARLLADVVGNFQTSQEEVTLIVNADKVAFKNYVDDEPDPQKVMHTELNLDPSEFDSCQIGTDTDVTFCLKELRAILAFAEASNLPVTINFDTAGKPIVFTIPGDKGFEANFVLATLADLQSANSQQRSVSQKSKLSKTKSGGGDTITEEPSRLDNQSTSKSKQPARVENGSGDGASHKYTAERLEAAYEELMEDDMDMELTAAVDVTMTTTKPLPSVPGGTAKPHPSSSKGMSKPSSSDSKNSLHAGKGTTSAGIHVLEETADPSTSSFNETRSVRPTAVETSRTRVSVLPEDRDENDRLQPDIPKAGDEGKKRGLDTALCDDESDQSGDDLDDTVPGTPPSKKFKSLFFGWSQSTTQASQANKPAGGSVLVEDSDDD